MSKSYGNTIDIFAGEKEMRKRVMGIVTDSTPVEAPKNPDASSIVQLFSLVATPEEMAAMRAAFAQGGTGYGDFKKQLFGGSGNFSRRCAGGGRKFSRNLVTSTKSWPEARSAPMRSPTK